MGQTHSGMSIPLISSTTSSILSGQDQDRESKNHSFQCKLTSNKQRTLVCTSSQHKFAHGTAFVYFLTPKHIQLSDYTLWLGGEADAPHVITTFPLASLRYHSEVVCMGEIFFQFVCVLDHNKTPNRLMARTKKCLKDDVETVLECLDQVRPWQFVLEIHYKTDVNTSLSTV